MQEDLRVLGKVSELLLLLKAQHEVGWDQAPPALPYTVTSLAQDVEREVEKTKDLLRKQLSEKHQEMTTNPLLTSLDLLVTTE